MRALLIAILVSAPALLSGCVWVKMEPGATSVRVVRSGQDLPSCQRRGEIAVSVKDRLGPYARNDLKVRDELETLARNEAVGLGADVIQPKGEPHDGEQRFLAYQCGGNVPVGQARRVAEPTRGGEAETFPIDD